MTIDPELDQLSRALIAATDLINSDYFREQQAKYLKAEADARALADELEAVERSVEKAQLALQQYVALTYLADTGPQEAEPDPYEDALFGAGEEITPIPTEEDEFATARRTGALS